MPQANRAYDPSKALFETRTLNPSEELAYRRLKDLVAVCRVPDDDVHLGLVTKLRKKWVKIKPALLAKGMIRIEGGSVHV